MIEYRTFRNYDPPHVVRLWNQAGLGRGAVHGVSNDESFDTLNYAQHYFDPQGLILALDEDDPVGFVHAGFGCDAEGDKLDLSHGVICAVIVHPEYRRQGIGRELVRRAEDYLRQRGSQNIFAGASPGRDPFYFGLYGGAQPVGFLESDANAAAFFGKLGYKPVERYVVTHRSMTDRDPVSFRLTTIRRKWELALVDKPEPCPWWWTARYSRLDALHCVLIPKGGGRPVAGVSVVGLDLYSRTWHEQAIGITDLWVIEPQRRQGYGQTLLIEVIKRLRQETISAVAANIPENDPAALALFRSVGFEQVDMGVVYKAP